MALITITIILILILGALILVAYPLWQQPRSRGIISSGLLPGQTCAEIEARYQATLASIKDLMFDYEMGKVSDEDYITLVTKSKSEAAKIRQQLDQMANSSAISSVVDAEIEALVATIRATPYANGHQELLTHIDRDIDQLKTCNGHCATCCHCKGRVVIGDAFCPSCGQAQHNGHATHSLQDACQMCGLTVEPGDAYCAGCGVALHPLQVSQLEKILAA